ncbi:MAG: hypothetical protein GEU93_06765 [Propionibacteriales bacterium]|nr:hypothetical protein [Propionibacteriales bacterium]
MYEEMGSPYVPAIAVGERVTSILHFSQIASILELSAGSPASSQANAWDITSIQQSYVDLLPRLGWDAALEPTPARGRSVRNITVNAFHPFDLVREAWNTRDFPWFTGDADVAREQPLTSMEKLCGYALDHHQRWQNFVLETGEALDRADPVVSSPHKGDIPYSVLLESQRWHLAYHFRHLIDALRRHGADTADAIDVEMLVDLPKEWY